MSPVDPRRVPELEAKLNELELWASAVIGLPVETGYRRDPKDCGMVLPIEPKEGQADFLYVNFKAAKINFWLVTHGEPELALSALQQLVINQGSPVVEGVES